VGISVVRPSELGSAEVAAWHGMQDRTPALASPFLSPEFTIAVGRIRSAARVAVLTEGHDITGFFPFERRRLGAGVPIAAGLTQYQGLVHAPGAEWDVRALLRACGISAWPFDHLVSGQKPFERYQATLVPSPVIDLSEGFAAYHASLRVAAPRFCSDVARKARKLAREVGELRTVADSREAGILRMLMGWKSEQYRRTGRPDQCSKPWIIELLDSLFATRASGLSGLLSVLYVGDIPVAAHFGLRSGPVLAHWFPAYDTRFARYSPGLIQHIRLVEESAASGVQLIDLGKGTKRYKETLKTGDQFIAEGIVARRSPLGAAHWACRAPQAWAIRQIRTHPPLFRAADTLLRRGAQASHPLWALSAAFRDDSAAVEKEVMACPRRTGRS
jgi:CelD/BcsL family acetyltransferase involved in cellulose biosynthesis